VLDAGLFGRIGEVFALLHFTLGTDRPKILHAVDAVDAAGCAIERRGIFEVAANKFNAACGQVPGRGGVRIAGKSPQTPHLLPWLRFEKNFFRPFFLPLPTSAARAFPLSRSDEAECAFAGALL
jgi:hypothetical protein